MHVRRRFRDIAAAGCTVIVLTISQSENWPKEPPKARFSVVTAPPSSSDSPAPVPPRPERQERIPLAIFLMISAGAIFSFSSAASKLLAETYPVGEVLFSRVPVSYTHLTLPTIYSV